MNCLLTVHYLTNLLLLGQLFWSSFFLIRKKCAFYLKMEVAKQIY